jgi:transcriptional regulator with XRE-family HTH domain
MASPDPLLVGLGEAIRDQREKTRHSQESLSLQTGVHRNYIGGIERAERRPTVLTLATLATALGLRPSQLLAQAEQHAEHAGAAPPGQCGH